MTQQQKKKAKERAQLQRFRECWPDFPIGEIIEQEEPDFVVKAEGTNVGIELRDFLYDEVRDQGAPSKRQESLSSRTLARANQLYQEEGLPPVNVSVLWHERWPLDSQSARNLEEPLLDLVKRNTPEPQQQIFLGYPADTWKTLPKEIVALWIDRLGPPDESLWAPHGGGALPQADVEDIERAILAKEQKIPAYRRYANQLWLLVVASGFTASGFCKIAPGLTDHCFRTDFDHLFFLHYPKGEVLKLNVEKLSDVAT